MAAEPPLPGPEWTRMELGRLKGARYLPLAWVRFIAAAFVRSAQDAVRMPRIRREALLVSGLGMAAWIGLLFIIPSAAWGVGWWTFVSVMLLTHLGMGEVAGESDPGLGLPNLLSLARAWFLPILIPAAASAIAFAGLLAAALGTDGLDGRIARSRGRETRLGKQLDHATDYALGVLAAVLAAQQGWLPVWVSTLIVLRFTLPVLALFAFYFWKADIPTEEMMASDRPAGILGAAGLMMSPFDSLRLIGIVLILVSATMFAAGLIRRPSAPAPS